MTLDNLTELENKVLNEICQQLATWRDDEPGYSCIDGADITRALNLKPKTTSGVIGSLCKKGYIQSDDGGDFNGIIYACWDKIPDQFGRETPKVQNDLITCPSCKGKGTITVTAKMLTEGKWVDQEPVIMTCMRCEGKKVVNKKEQEALNKLQEEFWCKCGGNALRDSRYYDDGEHPELSKHHYRCRTCGKVTQIG